MCLLAIKNVTYAIQKQLWTVLKLLFILTFSQSHKQLLISFISYRIFLNGEIGKDIHEEMERYFSGEELDGIGHLKEKGTSRQRSGNGAIRKRFPLQKTVAGIASGGKYGVNHLCTYGVFKVLTPRHKTKRTTTEAPTRND